MGVLYRSGGFIGGISKELVDKIGSVTLTTTAKDLSRAVNELKASKSDTDTMTTAYCTSEASATAKIAQCTGFSLKNNSYIPINFVNGNTVAQASGVTLNINNTGAKPIYVDWSDNSIEADKPFSAGTYILYYVSNAYYLFTDGSLYPYLTVAKLNNLKYYSFTSSDSSVDVTEYSSSSGDIIDYLEDLSVKKVNGHTVNSDVPSNAVFTDTNNAVTQTATDSTNNTYELLFSGTADNTTRTEGVRKSSNLIYNPYHKHIFMYDANDEEMVRIGIDEGVNYNSGAIIVRDTDHDYISLDLNGISSSYDLGLSSHEGVHVWYSFGNAHGLLYCGDIMKGDNNDTWDGTNTSLEDALSDKATKATTLAGYGITDAKIANGVITLGSNSITPLTSHQDISGKVNIDKWNYINGITSTSKSTADIGNWVSMCHSGSTGSPTLPTANQWWHVLSLDCWKGGPTNWVSQLAIATQSNSGVWWRRNSSGTNIDSASWTRLADANANGYANRALADGDGNTISSTYLKLSGGTLTGNTWVKRASGESQMGVINTTSGKSCYLYAVDSGTVGVYSSIGAALVAMDTSKKLYLNGTTYSIGNADKFRSAISLPTARVGWGTSVQIVAPAGHIFFMTNSEYGSLWLASTNDIQVTYSNTDGKNYHATGTGSVTWGNGKYKATRNGNTVTVTATSSTTITLFAIG